MLNLAQILLKQHFKAEFLPLLGLFFDFFDYRVGNPLLDVFLRFGLSCFNIGSGFGIVLLLYLLQNSLNIINVFIYELGYKPDVVFVQS